MSPPVTSAADQVLVGSILNNKYQILEQLSRGGMGVVYKARHLTLDTLVALKLLLQPDDETAQERFLSEARLASRIRHPNTVYISDFGVLSDGRAFLEMEFLDGRTLAAETSKGPMVPLRACKIAVGIARGLQAVHEKGIVHRDMKPENIFLLQQDGTSDFVKIVDFGIAKQARRGSTPGHGEPRPGLAIPEGLSPLQAAEAQQRMPASGFTMPGNIMGTPGYMAPEQIEGTAIGVRADQYALGCILYELIAGQAVFSAPTAHALMIKHMTLSPPPLSQVRPHDKLPDALEALLKRLLAKLPSERFDSMRDVERALTKVISAQQRLLDAAMGVPGSHPSLPGNNPRKKLVRAAVFSVAGLFGVISTTGAFYLHRLRQPTSTQAALGLAQKRQQALEILQRDLHGADRTLQLSAIPALGQSRDGQLRPTLEALLQDPEPRVRTEAARALGTLGDGQAVAALGELLQRETAAQPKLAAAWSLRQLGDARGQRHAEQQITSIDADAQARAVLLFCEQGPPDVQRILLAYRERTGLPLSIELGALGCLARAHDGVAISRLHSRLEVGTVEQKIPVAKSLAQAGDPAGQAYLRELSKKRSREQIIAAAELAQIDEPDGLSLFRALVEDPNAQSPARQLACEGLGAVGDAQDVVRLAPLLQYSTDPALRQASAGAIVRILSRDPGMLSAQSLAWARRAVTDGDALMRQSAVSILQDTPQPAALTLLRGLLGDQDLRVRRAAIAALVGSFDSASVQSLQKMLTDGDSSLRAEVLRGLLQGSQRLSVDRLAASIDPLRATLSTLATRSTGPEQALAKSLLVRLGDQAEQAKLRQLLQSSDPQQRRLAVEQLALSQPELLDRLQDTSPEVRFAAAQRLAAQGNHQAGPVLAAVAEQGGPSGLKAYSLLRKLGLDAKLPPELDAVWTHPDVGVRLAATDVLADLPLQIALPYLRRASRDRASEVRRQAAESAARLSDHGQHMDALIILRRLYEDSETSVRARASSLLVGLLRDEPPPVVAAAPKVSPPSPKVPDASPVPDAGAPPDAAEPSLSESLKTSGFLQFEGPIGAQVQIDQRPWLSTSTRPIPLDPGSHTLHFLGGQKTFSISPGKTTRVALPSSQAEQLAKAGLAALDAGDRKKGVRQIEKAVALCAQDRRYAVQCATFTLDLHYRLGQVHEGEKHLDAAMVEYQRVLAIAPQVRGKADIKAGAQAAATRLSRSLGQVILSKKTKRGCQTETQWFRTGTVTIRLGDKLTQVQVSPKEPVRLGNCEK